jgi:hypothetical protein
MSLGIAVSQESPLLWTRGVAARETLSYLDRRGIDVEPSLFGAGLSRRQLSQDDIGLSVASQYRFLELAATFLQILRPCRSLDFIAGPRKSCWSAVMPELTSVAAERLALANGTLRTAEEVVAREPDLIIGSWCGKKFLPERVIVRPGFDRTPAVQPQDMYEIKSSLILQPDPAALTDGLAAIQGIIER